MFTFIHVVRPVVNGELDDVLSTASGLFVCASESFVQHCDRFARLSFCQMNKSFVHPSWWLLARQVGMPESLTVHCDVPSLDLEGYL